MATIVLCQGFFGRFFDLAAEGIGPLRLPGVRYFGGIREALEGDGHRVLTPPTHPIAGIDRRARQIVDFLDAEVAPEERCLLVGHSMGGLDCREVIGTGDAACRIDGLLTIATPHHGTSFADFCLDHLQRQAGLYGLLGRFGLDVDAARHLTRDAMRRFNERTPDIGGVGYFSVTTSIPVSKMSPALRFGGDVIERAEGPNDGLVARDSAAWGEVIDHWSLDHLSTLDKHVFRPPDVPVAERWRAAVATALERLEQRGR